MMKKFWPVCLLLLALTGCSAPQDPQNRMETSVVDGTTLHHRHRIQPPRRFTGIWQQYQALYNASVMSTPGFNGIRLTSLTSGEAFQVLGVVENHWLAISDQPDLQLTGYVEYKAGVPAARYDATVQVARAAPRQPPSRARQECIGVGQGDTACRKGSSATWIIQQEP